MMQQAEDLFDAALFNEAIPIYQEALKIAEKGMTPFEKSIIHKIVTDLRARHPRTSFFANKRL